VKEGAKVALQLDDISESGGALTGTVVEIARAMDEAAHTFIVKISLPSGAPVRSGMFVRARFLGPPRPVLVVPATSVVRRGQLQLVFIVGADGRVRMRAVTIGPATADLAEVLAGVDAGESVVTNPAASILDGAPVRVVGAGQ
jgi:cobalt-zinc-cadmium efflux system membrane fusion protein